MRKTAEDAYEAHRGAVWALCYRMMGSAADADELLQDTFARLLERPPSDTDAPLRPWLFKVALNLSRDRLRRRKQQSYVGPWLPGPIETDGLEGLETSPRARYETMESVTLAFLRTLEALTPKQRAVLVLRDVYDLSVRETATFLDLGESNVKVIHHRARERMKHYDERRATLDPALRQRIEQALAMLLGALASGDEHAVRKALTEDVVFESDGGGEYIAALRPIVGADRVVRFLAGVRPKGPPRVAFREVNGLPAVLVEAEPSRPRAARRSVLTIEVTDTGQVSALRTVFATDKLSGVRFDF
ncbi:MAG: sigma-70 family RNA polymerase sigma factor [Myxococcota bacterium]